MKISRKNQGKEVIQGMRKNILAVPEKITTRHTLKTNTKMSACEKGSLQLDDVRMTKAVPSPQLSAVQLSHQHKKSAKLA